MTGHHSHGFDGKKIEMHVEYCKHLLEAAKVHLEAAEREEQQHKQKQEVARQLAMAEEAKRKAEEERKIEVVACELFWKILFVVDRLESNSYFLCFAYICGRWKEGNKKTRCEGFLKSKRTSNGW